MTDVFLSKKGILRQKSTYFDCPTDNKIIHFENINKDFEIMKKNNLITITKRKESKIDVSFEHSILAFTNKMLENPKVKIIKDFCCYLVVLILTIIVANDKKQIIKKFIHCLICVFAKRNSNPQVPPSLAQHERTLSASAPSLIHQERMHSNQGLRQATCDIYHTLYPPVSVVNENEVRRHPNYASTGLPSMNCQICSKICKGPAGLASHMRVHNQN